MRELNMLPMEVESATAFHELYPRLLDTILRHGRKVAPRGEVTYEVTPLIFSIENPRDCITLQRCRPMNYAYAIIEKLSLVYGVAEAETLCFYIPGLRHLLNGDGVFEGAYAPRLRRQLPYIYELLCQDPESRRATMTVFSSLLDHHPSKDIPCTLSLQFLLRDGQLILIANMRSSDIYIGLPYDVQQFTFLQQLMGHWLGVELGPYFHVAGSAHVYERDCHAINEVLARPDELNNQTEPPVDMSYEDIWQQVDVFFSIEKELRLRRIRHPVESPLFDQLGNYLGCCIQKIGHFIQRRVEYTTQLGQVLSV